MMIRILDYLNKHSQVLKRLFFVFLLGTVAYDFFERPCLFFYLSQNLLL